MVVGVTATTVPALFALLDSPEYTSSFALVFGPTMPMGSIALLFWKRMTACSVKEPKYPVIVG